VGSCKGRQLQPHSHTVAGACGAIQRKTILLCHRIVQSVIAVVGACGIMHCDTDDFVQNTNSDIAVDSVIAVVGACGIMHCDTDDSVQNTNSDIAVDSVIAVVGACGIMHCDTDDSVQCTNSDIAVDACRTMHRESCKPYNQALPEAACSNAACSGAVADCG